MGKYTFNDVVKEFNKKEDYTLLSDENEFVNARTKMRYICTKHADKGQQQIDLYHLKAGRGCYYCGREKTIQARKITDFNHEYHKELCQNNNFEYINTIRDEDKIYIEFVCNKHKELGIQRMTIGNMKRKLKGCKYCSGKDLPEWYVMKLIEEINPDVELLEPYNGMTKRIQCKCKKHNIVSRKSVNDILSGKGCVECGKEKQSMQQYLSLEEYQSKVSKLNSNVIVLNYYGWKTNADFKCALCGHTWTSSAASMVANGTTCPKCCHYFKTELKVAKILEKWGYTFIKQYKFKDCKDIHPLPFDFYLPNFNACIEYDGIFHFEPIFGNETLKRMQKHDLMKDNYCKTNNIKLIRISCYEDEEDGIEYVLFDKMVKNKLIIEH